ncbi:MAG: DUF29 domain-containing protein [Snowella sp.]
MIAKLPETYISQTAKLYNTDYQLWLLTTIKQLQKQDFSAVDWCDLIEELEGLAKQQQQELENRLIQLFEHLLKLAYWDSEREDNTRGWKGSIREQRKQISRLLKKNPSLKPYLLEVFAECYTDARDITIDKTGLSSTIFPTQPIAKIEEVLDENWLPS